MEVIPDEEIIIQDHLNDLRIVKQRKKVKNLLLISGGGVSATFFSMGALRCLFDNNLFNFDVISSVSGSTILLHFIEQSYHQGFYKEDRWYEKYIRGPLYEATKEPAFIKLLFYSLEPDALSKINLEYLNGTFKLYNRPLDTKKLYTKTDFRYNYLDANTQHVSDDHTDLVDPAKDFFSPNWYFFRLFRCTLPFTVINDRPAYDAGTADNNSLSTTLSQYDADNIFLVASLSDYIYKKYKKLSVFELYTNLIGAVTNASGKATVHLGDLSIEAKNIYLTKYSTNLDPSEDIYHKNLFSNYYNEISQNKAFYIGVLFENSDMLKVLENEGYIQMYYELKRNRKNKLKNIVFDIPNPDVYNSNVKNIYDDFKKLDFVGAIIGSVIKEIKKRIFNKK